MPKKESTNWSFKICALSGSLDGSDDDKILCIKHGPCKDIIERLTRFEDTDVDPIEEVCFWCWFTSRPSEREMKYQICDDIFSYKRMQVFNNVVFQIFTYGDDVPFESIKILGLYAISAIQEPVRAKSEV